MDRRVWGMCLVLAAVALVLPGSYHRTVGGAPVRAPTPAPPAVGDCIVRPVDEARRTAVHLSDGASLTMPYASSARCTGQRYGEVTAVWLPADAASVTVIEHLKAVDNCTQTGKSYLGVPASPPTPGGGEPAIGWEPAVGSSVVAIGPNPQQRAAGASWVACLVRPANDIAYAGSARASVMSARLPWDPHTCTVRMPSVVAQASCWQAHRAQLLGTAVINPAARLSAAELLSSCSELARLIMGTSDPTRKGALELRVLKDPIMFAYVSCELTPRSSRQLDASVLGLGERAAPLR